MRSATGFKADPLRGKKWKGPIDARLTQRSLEFFKGEEKVLAASHDRRSSSLGRSGHSHGGVGDRPLHLHPFLRDRLP